MLANAFSGVLIVALLVVVQTQAGNTQRVLPHNGAFGNSLSKASSTASERQLQLGALGISRGAVSSQSVTQNNGGFENGGTTSVANSKSRTRNLNLGGLGVGSTLTASKTNTNGAVSRGLSHNLNVGRLGVGSSLSRDNLRNGFGLQRSENGGLKLGLGLLNIDLSRNQQQPKSQALTQAGAQAQGEDAFAKSNSSANSFSKQFGLLGVTKTQSQSNAISGSRFGQSTAQAGGGAGVAQGNGVFRTRRSSDNHQRDKYVRAKRRIQFIPFAYPGSGFDLGNNGFSSPQKRSINAQGTASSLNENFEQQAGANTQSNQQSNENGYFANNDASSIGSNLATDGGSGQLSSANVNQDLSLTDDGSQNSNNAQSQALNFAQNQQQAANANAGTKEQQTANGRRSEARGGSQATNNDEYGSASNIANINAQTYEEGETRGSQADSSSQSLYQDNNGQNSAAQTNSHVNSVRGADGSITNSATSNASAVSRGGGSANASANAVASANASSGSGFDGNNSFGNANADSFGNFYGLGGAQANSGAFGNFNEARGFANGRSRHRAAFKKRQRKSFAFNTQLRPRQQTQTSSSLSTLEIINDSKEINWPQNRIQHYKHRYPQQQQKQQQQPQLPQRRVQQQPPQQKHTQHLHFSSINPNSSTEQFAVIDGNERHARTFDFISDLIAGLTQPTCIFPCTLDAYQRNRCCEVVPAPPPLPHGCCAQTWPPLLLRPPTTVINPPGVLPPPGVVPPSQPFPLMPAQCCISCPGFGFYGPTPCIHNTFPGAAPFFMG